MSLIKNKNTAPEMLVRKTIFSKGYRYRINRSDLPGCPDIVFPSKRKIIFVHGCYWHRHDCKKGKSIPSTNRDFWINKFENNKKNDESAISELKKLGWKTFIIWECDLKKSNWLKKIMNFLEN